MQELSGLLIINKPSGITSFSAVNKIKKLTGVKRVGHTGTLDPLATGVLPVFIGRPCALSNFAVHSVKEYSATILLGTVTDSYDITGNVVKTCNNIPSEQAVIDAVNSFVGTYNQVPPVFSAKKQNGTRLYNLARKGEAVTLKPQKVEIFNISNIQKINNNEYSFTVLCGKGTYIRSLVYDIGEKLSCGATLKALARTKNCGFDITEAVPLDSLTAENIASYILPAEKAVLNYKEVSVSGKQAVRFFNGGLLSGENVNGFSKLDLGETVRVKYNGEFIGMGKTGKEGIRPACPINKPSYTFNTENKKPVCLVLGTFDGVHTAHQKIIKSAKNYYVIAVTFSEVPKAFLGADVKPIMPKTEKTRLLTAFGVDRVDYLDFSEYQNMPPETFLTLLKEKYSPTAICTGFNYRYGSLGAGNTETLKDFCNKNNIECITVNAVEISGITVSSTKIREYITNGEIEKANSMLGFPYYIKGRVVDGEKRGRTLGFPTANQVYPENTVKLKQGVYSSNVIIDGKTYKAVTNVGNCPTFNKPQTVIESYVIGFGEDIYGKEIKTEFLRYMRPEIRFNSKEELLIQLEKDKKERISE